MLYNDDVFQKPDNSLKNKQFRNFRKIQKINHFQYKLKKLNLGRMKIK